MIRFALAFLFLISPLTASADDDGEISFAVLGFEDLAGWDNDNHQSALDVFRSTCRDMDDPDWRALCSVAHEAGDAKAFFELFFR